MMNLYNMHLTYHKLKPSPTTALAKTHDPVSDIIPPYWLVELRFGTFHMTTVTCAAGVRWRRVNQATTWHIFFPHLVLYPARNKQFKLD